MNALIVYSRFNEDVTQALVKECLRGFAEQNIEAKVLEVPGAVEIPLMIQNQLEKEAFDCVVALGCVIEGDTEHYEVVCQMCSQGIMEVMLKTGVPIVFEVLMVDEKQKALDRISKGYEAAFVATEMAQKMR
ncbi:6,7-dimethyl-8-ribityllumazine synthase [Candidatus Peregrinibacteria bacterium]|nr:MAG: 6,7-dimethyl-8-ribityllumazine synthase [Candidatus Peregrinibacteria bacterium]